MKFATRIGDFCWSTEASSAEQAARKCLRAFIRHGAYPHTIDPHEQTVYVTPFDGLGQPEPTIQFRHVHQGMAQNEGVA